MMIIKDIDDTRSTRDIVEERLEAARKLETNVWGLDSMEDSECSPANWLNCEEHGVPQLGIYVLGRYNGGNYDDSDDQEGVNCVWVKRKLDMNYTGQVSNNEKPYQWHPFGPGRYFGQEITHWCYVSRLPADELESSGEVMS